MHKYTWFRCTDSEMSDRLEHIRYCISDGLSSWILFQNRRTASFVLRLSVQSFARHFFFFFYLRHNNISTPAEFVEGYEQRWELRSVKHPWTSMLLCTLFTLGTRWKGRRTNYNPGCPSKMKKKSSWSPSPHRPGNLKPGVGSQRGIQGEEQCGSLCKRGRENKPFPLERDHVQAPSEKTTQGRSEPFLQCTRPHTRAQLNMYSIVRMEGWSEML